ncbi:MAG: hypothetical protein ACRCSK_02810, partial [Fusobacteriaceae bacterium]
MIDSINFPVKILWIHPHMFFNILSFGVNFFIYKKIKDKRNIKKEDELFFVYVTSATIICGIFGSIILHWFESPKLFMENYKSLAFYFSGT